MPATTTNPPACPVCGYDQSGLVESWTDACPLESPCSECGGVIGWREVFRPDLYAQRRFVEHPGAKLPAHLFGTLRRVVRPRRFWAWVPRSQPLARRRLVLASGVGVLLAGVLPALLVFGVFFVLLYPVYARVAPGAAPGLMISDPLMYTTRYYLPDSDPRHSLMVVGFVFHLTAGAVAWGWALLARHRGVRSRHIARVVAYGLVPLALLGVLDGFLHGTLLLFQYDFVGQYPWVQTLHDSIPPVIWLTVILFFAWEWHWWASFTTRYLRAQRARLTVFLYGLVTVLLFPIIFGLLMVI